MELRVLHTAARRMTWYGQWHYSFGRGGFNMSPQQARTAGRWQEQGGKELLLVRSAIQPLPPENAPQPCAHMLCAVGRLAPRRT